MPKAKCQAIFSLLEEQVRYALQFAVRGRQLLLLCMPLTSAITSSFLSAYSFISYFPGFIGSHTALCLLENGYKVTIFDNLDNSFQLAVDRVAELAGDLAANMTFIKADLRDYETLDKIFGENK